MNNLFLYSCFPYKLFLIYKWSICNWFGIERFLEDDFVSLGETLVDDSVFMDTGLTGNSMYIYRVKARNDSGYSDASAAVSIFTLPKPDPFFGTPSKIPGKIEAENYDYGEKNDVYYDSDNVNSPGKYRNDGVDIQPCLDRDKGYEIGWIENGEYLVYTVDVNVTVADIELRIASEHGGNIKLELDGVEIAKTDIKRTGGWSSWKTITMSDVQLIPGKNKKLKITFVRRGFNFNWINFK